MRLKQIESENTMPEYEVVVKPAEAMKIASIREVVPAVEQMPIRSGAMFTALVNWLKTKDQQPAGPALAMYYNPEYVESDIDVENAIVVNSNLEKGEFAYTDFIITVRDLPQIDLVASTVHRGDFDNLINAWQELARWIEQNDYELIHPPSREFYLSGPGEEPVAEVQYLVKPKA
jgi:effector-binding domain-containing protein